MGRYKSLKYLFVFLQLLALGAAYGDEAPPSPYADGINLPNQDPTNHLRFVAPFPELGDEEGSSFEEPVFLTHSGDGTNRLFVVERMGRIIGFPNRRDVTPEETFTLLNIKDEVSTDWWNEGLLGLAFDPQFKANGYFYVYFSRNRPRLEVVIRRYTAVVDGKSQVADPLSGLDIVREPLHQWEHLGGMMAFGKDGMLYVSLGDGVDPDKEHLVDLHGRALLGSLIRLDVRDATNTQPYRIPTDNPFVGIKNGPRPEIWAYGFRNPWRWSFDPFTGLILLGDGGHHTREEINIVEKGGNYGWPFYEGSLRFKPETKTGIAAWLVEPAPFSPEPKLYPPFFEYEHTNGLLCVVGGYVYSGKSIPSLRGSYVYGDFTPLPEGNPVWALSYDAQKRVVTKNSTLTRIARLSSFGVDEDGELYALSMKEGYIGRLTQVAPEDRVAVNSIPKKLSATGLFESLRPLRPAAFLEPYDTEKPFYSDGAEKRRWVVAAKATPADRTSTGTIFVKHFASDVTHAPIETRLLVRQKDGWRGYSYRWNAQASEATLVAAEGETFELPDDRLTQALKDQNQRKWSIPGRNACFSCHNGGSQAALGYTERKVHSPSTLDEKAAQYLRINCAYCHRPEGLFGLDWDFRTPEGIRKAFNANPKMGNLGIADGKIITPGHPERSILWERMRKIDSGAMPPLGRHTFDAEGVNLLKAWIQSQ